jgi:hypothetical protein
MILSLVISLAGFALASLAGVYLVAAVRIDDDEVEL